MADTGKGYAGFFAGKKAAAGRSAVGRKNFSTASEKIAEEMYQFEGPGLAVALGQYLMERCEEKTLGEQILLPHKSLEKAINFILQRVYEESKDYLQQNRNGQNGAGVAVSSQKVYHWLEEYYALDDAEEERKKKEEERERKRKAQEKTVVKGVKTSVKESKTKKDSQISLFDMLEDREKTEEKNDCV
ncbi:Cas9 inhibitor AcrIIA9 family protein [Mediterraneibacter sp.]|uniref:Cas9 inhibitor AcrIIA9 family protein n=1 Tax=Mediterraneibacter sp. TaxID=2316022 RepID=UPI003996C290